MLNFLKNKLHKIFHLPSPRELGWTTSKYDALPIWKNTNDPTPTWDDWEVKMRQDYPVRFFLLDTFPHWYRRVIFRRVNDFWYWVKCHTLSKYRYHILDLRQPSINGSSGYKWGFIDLDEKISYAMFNILNTFVNNTSLYCPSEEEVQTDPSLAFTRNLFMEMKAIHYWWNVERLRQEKEHSELLHTWSDAKSANHPDEHRLWDKLRKMELEQDAKEDEMLIRLINIRRSLWN